MIITKYKVRYKGSSEKILHSLTCIAAVIITFSFCYILMKN